MEQQLLVLLLCNSNKSHLTMQLKIFLLHICAIYVRSLFMKFHRDTEEKRNNIFNFVYFAIFLHSFLSLDCVLYHIDYTE